MLVSENKQVFTFARIPGELLGKHSTVSAYIAGESSTKACFVNYSAVCNYESCKKEIKIDLREDKRALFQLLAKTSRGEALVEEKLNQILNKDTGLQVCSVSKKGHFWTISPADPQVIYHEVALRDNIEEESELEGQGNTRIYSGFIFGYVPEGKEVEATGILFSHPKTDEISFVVDKLSPAQQSIEGFELTKEEITQLENYCKPISDYDSSLRIAQKNNPRVANHDEAKLACILCYFSPTWLEINGQKKYGTMRVMLFGDPRQAKGTIENYLRQKIKLGKHAIGETSSRTGITYTIDTEKGLIIWGLLVEADKQLAIIEAIHKFPSEDLATMRETLVKLYIEVRRMYTAKALARTRIIADCNGRQELGIYPFKIKAVRDLPCFKDQVDVTRWDIFIPFASEEVKAPEITKANLTGQDDFQFLSMVKLLTMWAWSRKPDQIIFSDEAKTEAENQFKALLEKYSTAEIPVIHEDSFFSILRMAAAFAVLNFSTVDGVSINVEKNHIMNACKLLERSFELLEVEDYKAIIGSGVLTEEDYKAFASQVDPNSVADTIVQALTMGPKNSVDLASITGHEASSIRRTAATLQNAGFLTKKATGYTLTSKGVKAWKRQAMEQRSANATNATNATATRTDPLKEAEKRQQEQTLRQLALDTFKRLTGEDRQPVEDKVFCEEITKAGTFTPEQALKVFQDLYKSGVIYEVRAHFFKKM